LLFFKGSVAQAMCVGSVIQQFERGTKQMLSPAKCSLLARDGMAQEERDGICSVLGVEKMQFEVKYLGLPTPEGRLKNARFQPLRERHVGLVREAPIVCR
jgi:hypothetical protein